MKIGFLLPGVFAVDSPFNGVREQARYQAEALERLGHEVVRMDPWQRYDFHSFDVLQFFVGGPTTFGIDQHLEPFRLKVFAPIIDTNKSNRSYRLAARLGLLNPKVFTIQGEYARHGHACELVIARSQHERLRLRDGVGIPDEKIAIVLNGVAPPEPVDVPRVRNTLQLPEEFILHISQITLRRKNVASMLEAIGPTDLPLILAGTYAVESEFQRLRQIMERYKNIRYIGPVDQPTRNALYAACRVFCLPSEHEGTGLVALEAASYGANIVVTPYGGPPDYFGELADYPSGLAPSAIRQAVLKAWERPRSDALREHVVNNLSWEQSARQLEQAYQKHLATA